jgi:hypothetical protein
VQEQHLKNMTKANHGLDERMRAVEKLMLQQSQDIQTVTSRGEEDEKR